MELAGIGKWGIPENRFTYNAQSEKQKDLNGGKGYFYETYFRGYDPQLGRFKQYEPLADLFSGISPYQYAFNNPIGFNDPTGLCPTCGEVQAAQEGEEEGPQEQTGIQSKGIAQVSASDISGSGATLQTVDIPTGDTPGGENHKFSDNSGIWAGWDNGSWVKGNVTTPVANPEEWFRGGETTYLPGLAISTTRPSKLEKFVRGTLFFLLDFTPIPDAYTLVTGKDLETGEESSRLAAGAWLVGSFFGGKILKVAGKLVGKSWKHLKRFVGISDEVSRKISKVAKQFRIKSLQKSLRDQKTVDEILEKMRDPEKGFDTKKYALGGYYHQGVYYISEGNHRMTAAILYFLETGDSSYIDSLLENTTWELKDPGSQTYDFPTKYWK